MEIITSHMNADFDAFASMAAAKKLYPSAHMVFPGSQEKPLRDFIAETGGFESLRIKDIDFDAVERLVIVDTRSRERLGPLSALASKPGLEVHIYDHHNRAESAIRGNVEVIKEVGATTTIFVEMLKEKGIKITPKEATLFCLGIYEETGKLLFPTTTERDVLAAAHLIKSGASLKVVSKYLRAEYTPEELDLLNELVKTSRDFAVKGLNVKIAKAERDVYFVDAARFAHRIMDMGEADALFLLLSMEGKILIVGRSRAPELDVSEALSEFGGGGHSSAGSATVQGMPFEILEERLLGVLRESVRPDKTAGDIMTRPVITADAGSTIKDASSMMTRYGVNVLPIVEKGAYRGVITREIVEKAIFHRLRANKATDFMSTDFITVSRDTPIHQVETGMIEQNQRFMPVLEEGKIIGAITRTDLLRVLYEDYLRRRGISEGGGTGGEPITRDVSRAIKDGLPDDIYSVLRLAGSTADEMGMSAFMVGGSVRDLIMGNPNLDIDMVVEGDGIAFSETLAGKLGAHIKTHARFGTAKIRRGGLRLDVATARTEYYESPAALPRVVSSSIKKDLYRRDFTINALALRLNPEGFGTLVDFFGGQRDIKEKKIRVLHNLSFVEDPTRAFRAVRFAERFGLGITKHTRALIKSAVKMNLFEKLTGSRLYDELVLAFKETEPLGVLKSLDEFGLLEVIYPGLKINSRHEAVLKAVHDAILWFRLSFPDEDMDVPELYIMALISKLKDDAKKDALRRLSVPNNVAGRIIKDMTEAERIVKTLPLKDNAKICGALEKSAMESVLFTMSLASGRARQEITDYVLRLRFVKPLLTGNDLKAMGMRPGPAFSRVLKELLGERLRGKIESRADEEAFVKAFIRPS